MIEFFIAQILISLLSFIQLLRLFSYIIIICISGEKVEFTVYKLISLSLLGVKWRFFTLLQSISWIDIYKWLRHVNLASYMFYFDFKDFELIWSVPETFVKITWGKVLTRPLVWTRRVWKTLQDFKRLKHELQNDPKEKVEHAMLIDLIRNDLSKNCEPWSIKVRKKCMLKNINMLCI